MEQHFSQIQLDQTCHIWQGKLPNPLLPDQEQFESLWELHPLEHPVIQIHGRQTPIPRWQQAYGRDYQFSGGTSKAETIPEILEPFLAWAKKTVHKELNGLLVNWYDGKKGHYIGKHRDSTKGLLTSSPITTISFGETRIFRLRAWKKKETHDFLLQHGDVFVIPFETNLHWTHEVPKRKTYTQRRISVTLRAFEE